MSVHKECGELINWFRRPDDLDRYLPPMDYVGQYYMATETESGEKAGVQVACYTVHNCDPDKMLAWQEYQAKIATIKQHGKEQAIQLDLPQNAWEMARDRRQADSRTFAEQVECPACNAAVDQPCYNLAKYRQSGDEELIVPTKNPHPSRLTLAEKESQ